MLICRWLMLFRHISLPSLFICYRRRLLSCHFFAASRLRDFRRHYDFADFLSLRRLLRADAYFRRHFS